MTDVDSRTTRRRKLIGGGLVVAFAVVLIAIVVVRSAGEKVLNENGETLVLVGKDTDVDGRSTSRGILTDLGGCLGVVDSDGAETVVVWPHGTTITTPEPLVIKVDGRDHPMGSTIEVPALLAEALEKSDYFYNKVPPSCRDYDVAVAG